MIFLKLSTKNLRKFEFYCWVNVQIFLLYFCILWLALTYRLRWNQLKKIMGLYNSHWGNRVRQKFPIFCWDNHHDKTSHMCSNQLSLQSSFLFPHLLGADYSVITSFKKKTPIYLSFKIGFRFPNLICADYIVVATFNNKTNI